MKKVKLFESITGISPRQREKELDQEKDKITAAITAVVKKNRTSVTVKKLSLLCESWLINQGFHVAKRWIKTTGCSCDGWDDCRCPEREVYQITISWPSNIVRYRMCPNCHSESYPQDEPLPNDWKRCTRCERSACSECWSKNKFKCMYWECRKLLL